MPAARTVVMGTSAVLSLPSRPLSSNHVQMGRCGAQYVALSPRAPRSVHCSGPRGAPHRPAGRAGFHRHQLRRHPDQLLKPAVQSPRRAPAPAPAASQASSSWPTRAPCCWTRSATPLSSGQAAPGHGCCCCSWLSILSNDSVEIVALGTRSTNLNRLLKTFGLEIHFQPSIISKLQKMKKLRTFAPLPLNIRKKVSCL